MIKSKLLNGDSFKLIKSIPDNSVDLLFTDPPYNLNPNSTGNIKFKKRKDINNDIADWDKNFNPMDLKDEFIRVIQPTGNIFIFCSYNLIGQYHSIFDSIFDTFGLFTWHKTNPVPNIRKSSFLNSCEYMCYMWNKGHQWNFESQKSMHNYFESPICMGNERLNHPTQKPLKVLKHIIKIASDENAVILDPFAGVMSIPMAAFELNRRFIGIEIDKGYFKQGVNRFGLYANKFI